MWGIIIIKAKAREGCRDQRAINLILSGIYFNNAFGSGSVTFNRRFVTIMFSSGPGVNKKVATPNGFTGRINITMVNTGDMMRMRMMMMLTMMTMGVATSDGCGRPRYI